MNLNQIWSSTLGELEITLNEANYHTWLKNTFIADYQDQVVVIGVPSGFVKEWLKNKFHSQIFTSLKKQIPDLKTVDYRITFRQAEDEPNTNLLNQKAAPAAEKAKSGQINNLNRKYIFETFVVGGSNKLAHAAAMAVGQKPGKSYNPLFIYGGSGLGKTHLLQAIGNELIEHYPNKSVLYISCEEFTNEFINSISQGKIDNFKKTYRFIDALLIDDIQFLAGKESTKEEFFHTFNSLYEKNKQIVISSDRPPKEIPNLESRLKSRFEWGMIADIQPPDFEMRKAILQAKAIERSYDLPDEVINYIAENIASNIRELEGALNRLVADLEVNHKEPTLGNTADALSELVTAGSRRLSPEKIFEIVQKFYNIANEDLLSTKRNKEYVLPRQIVMFLLRSEMRLSYPQIAQKIGKKDHTTIMHGCGKIENQLNQNKDLQKEIAQLKEQLYLI